MLKVIVEDWGLIDYSLAWSKQLSYIHLAQPDQVYVIFCEHPPVITIGRKPEGTLFKAEQWQDKTDIAVLQVDRGGSITAHFPGQLMVYVLFSLKALGMGLKKWLETLEEIIWSALREFGVDCYRRNRGLWYGTGKIASFGIAARRWWVYHGCSIVYRHWEEINQFVSPCGINEAYFLGVDKVLGRTVARTELIYPVTKSLVKLFYSR